MKLEKYNVDIVEIRGNEISRYCRNIDTSDVLTFVFRDVHKKKYNTLIKLSDGNEIIFHKLDDIMNDAIRLYSIIGLCNIIQDPEFRLYSENGVIWFEKIF